MFWSLVSIGLFLLVGQASPSDAPDMNAEDAFEDPFAGQPEIDEEPYTESMPSEPIPTELETSEEFSAPDEDPLEAKDSLEAEEPMELDAEPAENFEDPFEEEPSVSPPAAARPIESAPQTPDPVVLPPEPDAPSVSGPENAFEFPKFDGAQGPISEEVFQSQMMARRAPPGTWQWSFKPGIGLNINRRPAQMSFETELGYRIWKSLDLNLLANFRFMKDRMAGLVLMPSYTFNLKISNLNRFDLRLGIGTGWILRGISGAGFQYGYLPVRTDMQLTYYALPKFGLFASVGTESHLLRVSTEGEYYNEFQGPNGPPTQALIHLGIRLEY